MNTSSELEALEVAISDLEQWRRENVDKVGTPQFMRTTIAHRALIDLRDAGGGTPEQRAAAMKLLSE